MHRPLLLLAAVVPFACQTKSSPNGASTSDCLQESPPGWLTFVASHPQPATLLEDAHGGWAFLYQRRYVEALRAFESSPEPEARLAAQRTHILLGRLYKHLGRFTASSLVRYFKERDALGPELDPLKKRPFFEYVARALVGLNAPPLERNGKRSSLRNGSRAYGRLVAAWPRKCPRRWPARLDVYGIVAHRLACGSQLNEPCPKVKRLPRARGYARRIATYYAALCKNPTGARISKLRRLASTPAATEALIRTIQDKPIEAAFTYYDPIALFALSEAHLRLAQSSARPKDIRNAQLISAWAAHERNDERARQSLLAHPSDPAIDEVGFLLSEWRDARTLKDALAGPTSIDVPDTDELIAQFRKTRADYERSLRCGESESGRQVARELQLSHGLAAAEIRRAVPPLAGQSSCQSALPVLRATADRSAFDRPSWLNEPSFLVRWAEAAQCMGRSTEAIGALNAVEREYPEARAALAAAESLAVVRLMGGSVGTQKTP